MPVARSRHGCGWPTRVTIGAFLLSGCALSTCPPEERVPLCLEGHAPRGSLFKWRKDEEGDLLSFKSFVHDRIQFGLEEMRVTRNVRLDIPPTEKQSEATTQQIVAEEPICTAQKCSVHADCTKGEVCNYINGAGCCGKCVDDPTGALKHYGLYCRDLVANVGCEATLAHLGGHLGSLGMDSVCAHACGTCGKSIPSGLVDDGVDCSKDIASRRRGGTQEFLCNEGYTYPNWCSDNKLRRNIGDATGRRRLVPNDAVTFGKCVKPLYGIVRSVDHTVGTMSVDVLPDGYVDEPFCYDASLPREACPSLSESNKGTFEPHDRLLPGSGPNFYGGFSLPLLMGKLGKLATGTRLTAPFATVEVSSRELGPGMFVRLLRTGSGILEMVDILGTQPYPAPEKKQPEREVQPVRITIVTSQLVPEETNPPSQITGTLWTTWLNPDGLKTGGGPTLSQPGFWGVISVQQSTGAVFSFNISNAHTFLVNARTGRGFSHTDFVLGERVTVWYDPAHGKQLFPSIGPALKVVVYADTAKPDVPLFLKRQKCMTDDATALYCPSTGKCVTTTDQPLTQKPGGDLSPPPCHDACLARREGLSHYFACTEGKPSECTELARCPGGHAAFWASSGYAPPPGSSASEISLPETSPDAMDKEVTLVLAGLKVMVNWARAEVISHTGWRIDTDSGKHEYVDAVRRDVKAGRLVNLIVDVAYPPKPEKMGETEGLVLQHPAVSTVRVLAAPSQWAQPLAPVADACRDHVDGNLCQMLLPLGCNTTLALNANANGYREELQDFKALRDACPSACGICGPLSPEQQVADSCSVRNLDSCLGALRTEPDIIRKCNRWRARTLASSEPCFNVQLCHLVDATFNATKETICPEAEPCVDDINGLLGGQSCARYIPLGCNASINEAAHLLAPTVFTVADVCPASCGVCGSRPPLTVDVVCPPSSAVLDACQHHFSYTLKRCPNADGLAVWETSGCSQYRFCPVIVQVLENNCNAARGIDPSQLCLIALGRIREKNTGLKERDKVAEPACDDTNGYWLGEQVDSRTDEVMCVDRFTGREMLGTRLSRGREGSMLTCKVPAGAKVCFNPEAAKPNPPSLMPDCVAGPMLRPSVQVAQFVVVPLLKVTMAAPLRPDQQTQLKLVLTQELARTGALGNEKSESTIPDVVHLTNKLDFRFENENDTVVNDRVGSSYFTLAPTMHAIVDIPSGPAARTAARNFVVEKLEELQAKRVLLEATAVTTMHLWEGAVMDLLGKQTLKHVYGDVRSHEGGSLSLPYNLGHRGADWVELYADFGAHGHVMVSATESIRQNKAPVGEYSIIHVNISDAFLQKQPLEGVTWGIYNGPPEVGGCPIPDDDVTDPWGLGNRFDCYSSSSSMKKHTCRVGDLVRKHGLLSRHIGTSFLRDYALPVAGWASVRSKYLVIGSNPPVCALLQNVDATNTPNDGVSLTARFVGTTAAEGEPLTDSILTGTVQLSQVTPGRDTVVSVDLVLDQLGGLGGPDLTDVVDPGPYAIYLSHKKHGDFGAGGCRTKFNVHDHVYNPFAAPSRDKTGGSTPTEPEGPGGNGEEKESGLGLREQSATTLGSTTITRYPPYFRISPIRINAYPLGFLSAYGPGPLTSLPLNLTYSIPHLNLVGARPALRPLRYPEASFASSAEEESRRAGAYTVVVTKGSSVFACAPLYTEAEYRKASKQPVQLALPVADDGDLSNTTKTYILLSAVLGSMPRTHTHSPIFSN